MYLLKTLFRIIKEKCWIDHPATGNFISLSLFKHFRADVKVAPEVLFSLILDLDMFDEKNLFIKIRKTREKENYFKCSDLQRTQRRDWNDERSLSSFTQIFRSHSINKLTLTNKKKHFRWITRKDNDSVQSVRMMFDQFRRIFQIDIDIN